MRVGTATAERIHAPVSGLTGWLTTTDHKRIGILYIATSYLFFLFGGLLALLMRAELAAPGLQVMDAQAFDELFTMHGTIMLLLFGTPMGTGLAQLHRAAPDRRRRTSRSLGSTRSTYWLFLFGALVVLAGFLDRGRCRRWRLDRLRPAD